MRLKKYLACAMTAVLIAGNLTGFITPIGEVYADESFKNSLVAELKFDGDLKDTSGNGNDGTAKNEPEYAEGVDGKAMHFAGNNYVDLGTSAALQPDDLTVSMWIKADGKLSGENMLTWFKPDGNYQGKGWYLSSLDDSTPLKISIGESSGQPMEAYVSADRATFFPDGEWVHIAVTFESATQTVQIFRNGISQEVLYLNTASYITQDESSNKYIGFNSPRYGGGYAKVYMDDFKIYSKAASSADAIALYTEHGAEFDGSQALKTDEESLSLPVTTAKYNITLPTEGNAGSTITWSSSNESVISNTGVVTRPAMGEADVKVTLTATLTFGSDTATKTFEVTVPAVTDFSTLADFDISDIELIDEYLVNAEELEIKYLKSFDSDRLLKGFASEAGVSSDATLYGGWENSAIKGHTLGHYLTAVAQAYDATGDDELLEILNYMIDKLSEYQKESGYLAAIPESHYIQLEQGNTTGTWVPWYTMHKVMSGLIKVYEVTGNDKALTVASKLGDWVYSRTGTWTEDVQAKVLGVEYGGMNDCLYELYSYTKNPNHLSAAHSFDEMKLFESLYNGKDVLDGLHANTTIPKIIGALNRYIVLGEGENGENLYYLQVAENFWQIVVNNHTYITGGNSEWEHFGKSQVLDAERTNCNCETCNTYNMLKLSRELYKITGDAKYTDYYENTFINAILSSQNPETGMTTYFQPMATGFYKVYSSEFNHFWCCTGSGMENFSKLEDSIYYHNDNDLYVTAYYASKLNWAEKNLVFTQENSVTDTDTLKFTIEGADEINVGIKFRVPDWAVGDAVVKVNGEAADAVVAGGLINAGQTWKNGDVIEITFNKEVVAYGLPDNDSVVAFKYGPVVLSAALGTESMNNSTTGVNVTVPTKNGVTINENIGVKDCTVEEWLSNVAQNVEKDRDGFVLKNTNSNLVFTPHYKQYKERYGIYFYLVEAGESESEDSIISMKDKNRREQAIIDSVPVSNDQYELQHEMVTDKSSTGSFGGLMYRDASQGGYFQYTMKVDSEKTNILAVTYYSGDVGRTFSIYADDELIADVTLEKQETEGFYTVNYNIPEDITEGKDSVDIKFAADKTGFAGGAFDRIIMMRAYNDEATFDDIIVNGESSKEDVDLNEDVIEIYVGKDTDKAVVKYDLTDDYGLLYINGELVDDTKEFTYELTEETTEIRVKVVAEDHETSKEYKVKLIKDDESKLWAVILIVVIFVSVSVITIFLTHYITKNKLKKKNEDSKEENK